MPSKTRKSDLADALKRQILTLELPPGSDLDEAQLCEAYGLSRTPVREVFRDLDGLGYIQIREQRSPKVCDLSHITLRNFFLAAPMIYGAVLQLAASNAREDQIAALRTAQDAFKSSLRTGSAADRTLANYRFHEITGDMAGSVYLLPSFHRLLIDHARIGMTFYQPRSNESAQDMAEASRHHDEIIRAIEDRDEAAALQLAEDHWALSRDRMGMFLMPDALNQPLGRLPTPQSA
ncbi:MAG: GntR family transcriptional regulator [Pseudomonadota bacterium]